MNSIIKNLIEFVSKVTMVIGLLLIFHHFNTSDVEKNNQFSYSDIQKIAPHVIIDDATLISEEGISTFISQIRLSSLFIQNKLKVVIESNGGVIKIADVVYNSINQFIDSGVYVECHVTKASSVAFTLMTTLCSNTIVYGDFIIMSHPSYVDTIGSTVNSKIIDMILVKKESQALGIDFQKWLSISRLEEDKYYTKEELIKYNISTEFKKLPL